MNDALKAIVEILARLGLRYAAVGSIASSVHGLPRFTNDADLLIDIRVEQISPLADLARGAFYLDVEEAERAVAGGRAFNLIHFASAAKVDLFPCGPGEFNSAELSRSAEAVWVAPGGTAIRLQVTGWAARLGVADLLARLREELAG